MPVVKGLILNAAAIDATRTWVNRIQEPLAGLANLLIPMWGILPPSDPTRYLREPAEVRTHFICAMLLHCLTAEARLFLVTAVLKSSLRARSTN